MTSDDWWTRLVYEDPTPVAEMRLNHMSKLHISTARHLVDSHGQPRYEAQVSLFVIQALHNDLHGPATNWATAHPHAAMQ
jgi:hypothetical protein